MQLGKDCASRRMVPVVDPSRHLSFCKAGASITLGSKTNLTSPPGSNGFIVTRARLQLRFAECARQRPLTTLITKSTSFSYMLMADHLQWRLAIHPKSFRAPCLSWESRQIVAVSAFFLLLPDRHQRIRRHILHYENPPSG